MSAVDRIGGRGTVHGGRLVASSPSHERAFCQTCHHALQFGSDLLTGASVESCDRCGYSRPMTRHVETPALIPPDMVFHPEDLPLTPTQRLMREIARFPRAKHERVCVRPGCGVRFHALESKDRDTCSQKCWYAVHGRKKRERRYGLVGRGGPGRKPSSPTCPTCGGERVRGAVTKSNRLGLWVCHPCNRRRYQERKAA